MSMLKRAAAAAFSAAIILAAPGLAPYRAWALGTASSASRTGSSAAPAAGVFSRPEAQPPVALELGAALAAPAGLALPDAPLAPAVPAEAVSARALAAPAASAIAAEPSAQRDAAASERVLSPFSSSPENRAPEEREQPVSDGLRSLAGALDGRSDGVRLARTYENGRAPALSGAVAAAASAPSASGLRPGGAFSRVRRTVPAAARSESRGFWLKSALATAFSLAAASPVWAGVERAASSAAEFSWWAPAAGVAAAALAFLLGLRFLRKSVGGGSALEAEAKSMSGGGGDRKPEVFFPNMYRGVMDLQELSDVQTELSPEAQARVDAVSDLVKIGLWPHGLDDAPRREALARLEDPSPAMRELLEELGLSVERVRSWPMIVDPHRIDVDNDIPSGVMGRMVEIGLDRLKKPKKYGGLGMHQLEYGEVLRALASLGISSVATDISVSNTIGYAPQAMFGTERQKEEYLNRRGLASFGLTEPGAGTDTKKVDTKAVIPDELDVDLSEFAGGPPKDRRAARDWQSRRLAKITRALQDQGELKIKLSGEKVFITGLIDANVVYVVAGHTMWRGEDLGPTVVIVDLPFEMNEEWDDKRTKLIDLKDRGMRVTPFTRDGFRLPVIRGTDQTYIEMKDFEVPADRVLGKVGEGIQVPLKSLNAGRIGFGPVISRAAAWFASRMLEWAVDREMFDMYKERDAERGTQGDMEYAQVKIGAAHRKVAALNAVSRMTSALADANPDMGVAALSAAIKARVASDNWDIAQDARELGGGHALIEGAPGGVERDSRYAWIFKIVEGVDPAMAQAVHLFAGFAVRAEMMTLKGAAKFFLNQMVMRMPLLASFLLAGGLGALFFLGWAPALAAWAAAFGAVTLKAAVVWRGKGVFSFRDAWFLKTRAASFAFRFGMTAMFIDVVLAKLPFLKSRAFGFRQNTLIHAYNAEMDLFTLASVLRELRKNGSRMSAEDRLAAESAARALRIQIDRGLSRLSPWGEDPIEAIDRRLGAALVRSEKGRKDSRPNRMGQHMDWMRAESRRWWDRLEAAEAFARTGSI